MIDGIVPSEIESEGDSIRATLADGAEAADAAAVALKSRAVTRIHLIGNGTSYHSSLAAATWYRRSANASDPTVIAMTAGEFRNYLPALGPRDAVVAISASGEFRDVLAVAEALRGSVPTVGIVHVPGSSLEGLVDYIVRSAGGPSHVPVMTKTFVSTLTATLMLLAGVLGGQRREAARQALGEAADAVDDAVREARPRVAGIAESLLEYEPLLVGGSGNASAAAFEAALKLKEMALVHAEGTESWEMASGAATIVRPGIAVIAIAPAGPGREATLDVAGHARDWGAHVVEVGPANGHLAGALRGSDFLPLPDSAIEDLSPLTAVAPVALLAFVLARLRGHDPDRPAWVERYHSQGLRHIVGV